MSDPIKMKYGQTPWDDMPREELLREMQRAYAAAQAARSALALAAGPSPSAFWGPEGTGGRALAMCEAVTSRVEEKYSSEDVYRAFFRYAVDLLFTPELGHGWNICEKGHMLANVNGSPMSTCSQCKRPMRRIEWRDIEPPSTLPKEDQ